MTSWQAKHDKIKFHAVAYIVAIVVVVVVVVVV